MRQYNVLNTEPKWFEKGAKEAIHSRAMNSSLSKDGGRYNLSPNLGHHKDESEDRQVG